MNEVKFSNTNICGSKFIPLDMDKILEAIINKWWKKVAEQKKIGFLVSEGVMFGLKEQGSKTEFVSRVLRVLKRMVSSRYYVGNSKDFWIFSYMTSFQM